MTCTKDFNTAGADNFWERMLWPHDDSAFWDFDEVTGSAEGSGATFTFDFNAHDAEASGAFGTGFVTYSGAGPVDCNVHVEVTRITPNDGDIHMDVPAPPGTTQIPVDFQRFGTEVGNLPAGVYDFPFTLPGPGDYVVKIRWGFNSPGVGAGMAGTITYSVV